MDLCYRVGFYNRLSWEAFLERNPKDVKFIEETRDELAISELPVFVLELFARLFDATLPELPAEQQRPEAIWAKSLHLKLTYSRSFEQLQVQSKNQVWIAAQAAMQVFRNLAPMIPRPKAPIQCQGNRRALVIAMKKMGDPEAQTISQTEVAEGKASVQAAIEYAKTLDVQYLEHSLSLSEAQIRTMLSDVETFSQVVPGSSLKSQRLMDGNLSAMTELHSRLKYSERLRKIVDMVGRILPDAQQRQRQKSRRLRQRITGVTTGDHLPSVLPIELLNLRHPQLKAVFADRYVQRVLLQYQMVGEQAHRRGPIVICLDSSGTMRNLQVRETWAKALTWTVLSIAAEQKRDVIVLHWGTIVHRVDEFPASGYPMTALLDCMKFFANSGSTDGQTVVTHAVELIATQGRYKKADILFITDGGCRWTHPQPYDRWVRWFREEQRTHEFRFTPIVIGARSMGAEMRIFVKPEQSIILSDLVTNDDIDRANQIFDDL